MVGLGTFKLFKVWFKVYFGLFSLGFITGWLGFI